MIRRRRNKLVVWEWSRSGRETSSRRDNDPARGFGRQAVGAAALLGAILFILSRLPASTSTSPAYGRNPLAVAICDAAGVEPDTAVCVAVSVSGWFAIVVTIGIALKVIRGALRGGSR